MTAPLRRVAVRPPSAVGDYVGAHWLAPEGQTLDLDLLAKQHQAFVEILQSLGAQVEILPAADNMPDAIFTYDPAFVVAGGVIELRAAKAARVPENALLTNDVEALGVPVVGRLTGDARADGGDMCWLDDRTLAVGRTYRTNAEGVRQIREILATQGISVQTYDMPHALGPEYCLHLMSVWSPVRDDLAVVYEREAPVSLLQDLAARGIKTINVPDEDYLSLGCNVLAVAPGVVVMASGNDATAALLRAEGCEVHIYEASQISIGEGGPTCLTRPILRSA